MIFKRVCLGFALAIASALVYAADCSQYLGKGYCTDYIFAQTGQRQPGDAQDWNGDHDLSLLQKGDVAIFDLGTYGHVALVENVNKDSSGTPVSVNLSEWNYGPTYVNEACAVTNAFGIRGTRENIPVSTVDRFWHIGKGESPACIGSVCGDAVLYHAKLKTAQTVRFGLEMISVTDVGWRPLTERCEEAQQYFYLAKSSPASQKFMAMPAPNSICANVVQACFAQ